MTKKIFMDRNFLFAGRLPKLQIPVFLCENISSLTEAQMQALEDMYWDYWDEAYFAAIFVMDSKTDCFAMRPNGFLDKHITSEGDSFGIIWVAPCP